MTDTYVILFERGSYKGIVGPYTPGVAKKTIRYWKRKRSLSRRAYTVVASSHDDAFRKTLGVTGSRNPIATRNVLLGVAALGALGAVVYAVNASAKPATLAPGSAPPNPTASGSTGTSTPAPTPTSGSSTAPLSPPVGNETEG